MTFIDVSAIKISLVLGILSKALNIFAKFFLAGFLGPTGFSAITLVNSHLRWMSFFNFGILSLFIRRVAKLYFKNEHHAAQKLSEQILTTYILLCTVSLFLILVPSMIFGFIGLELALFTFLLKVSSIYLSITQAYFKGKGEFKKIAAMSGVLGIIIPIFTIPLVFAYGLSGYFSILFILELALSYYFARNMQFSINFINIKLFRKFIRGSLSTYSINILDSFMLTYFVLHFTRHQDWTSLGVFGFYLSLLSGKTIPFLGILAPMVKRQMVEYQGNHEAMRNLFEVSIVRLDVVMTTIVNVIIFVIFFVVSIFLTDYVLPFNTAILIGIILSHIVNRYWYHAYGQLTETGVKIVAVQMCILILLFVSDWWIRDNFIEYYLIFIFVNYCLIKAIVINQLIPIRNKYRILVREIISVVGSGLILLLFVENLRNDFTLLMLFSLVLAMLAQLALAQLLGYLTPVRFNFAVEIKTYLSKRVSNADGERK